MRVSRGDLVRTGAAVAFAGFDTALYLLGQRTSGPLGPAAGLAVSLVVSACLIIVSRFPRTVAVLVLAIAILVAAAPEPLVPRSPLTPVTLATAIPALLWCLAFALPRRQVVAFAAVFALVAVRPWAPSWIWLYAGLSSAVPALLGLYVRTRRELLSSLRERAELAQRERVLLAEQAKASERQRLAAEMHDIVTHNVTEIVLHAGALRVSSADHGVRAAAEQIRHAGERTLTELRELIDVLRRPDERDLRPRAVDDVPLASEVSRLVAGAGGRLTVTGRPDTAPPAIARAVHRLVQESLTNARKHAPGAAIAVSLGRSGDRVSITVENGPATERPDPALTASGSAAGLEGLRRRVRLLGGAFTADPTSDGGFRVSADLPATVKADPLAADPLAGRERGA